MSLFNITNERADDLYTRKTEIPQYLPSRTKPPIESLVDYTKYSQLIRNINNSNVSEEEKKFLRFGAARHLVFNYSKIADYYAHSDKEMQELIEQSALVLLDIDDAIANGYVKLSSDIEKIMKTSGDKTKDAE